MNSYIEFLEHHSEYEITKNTLFLPNVTYCGDNQDVHYSPVIGMTVENTVITVPSVTYDGTSHLAEGITVTVNGVTLVNGVDYEVLGNVGWTDAGTYNYTIKGLKNYKNSVTGSFTIDKAAGSVTTQPTANSLTYNTQAQALVTAGSGTGDIRYKLDEGEWSDSIPTATNAGTYIVSYKVLESANYLESSEGSETVIIDKITPTVVAPTAKTLTYNTGAQDLINLGSTDFGTMQYSLDETNWITTSPQGTAYGSYTVYYRVVGDSNTYDVAPSSINVSIAEKVVNAPTIELSQSTYTYDGNECQPTVVVKDGNTVIPSNEYNVGYVDNINAGTATVNITDRPFGNYTVNGSTTFTINKATGSVTTDPTANSITYNGTAQALVTAGVGTGTMMYKLGDGEWSSTIPSATDVDTYTVYFKAAESANYLESTVDSLSVSIAKVTPTVTAPTPKTLTYNTQAQVLADDGATNWGTIQYSLSENGTYSTSVPSQTNANVTYQVWYKVVGNSNVNDVAPAYIECMIAEKRVTTPTITLSQDSYTYSGSACQPTPTVKDGDVTIDPAEYTVEYLNNTNVGTATVVIVDKTAGNYYIEGTTTFTISKAAPTYTAPANANPTYNGSAQNILTAGSTSHGTIQYSSDGSTWSTTIPQQTNAGTSYTVYWRLVGDDNHTDVASTAVTCSIAKANPTYTAPTAKSLTYTGNAQALLNAGSTSHGTITYSSNNSSFSSTIPTGTAAGSYTSYWKLTGDSNHNDVASASVATTIVKAAGSVSTAPTNRGVTYTGSNQNLVNAGSGTGTMYYRVGTSGNFSTSIPQASAVGSYTVYYYAAESANYSQSSTGSMTATIVKAAGSVTSAPTNRAVTYNGGNQNLVNAGSGTGTMYYKLNSGSWSTSIPQASTAGSYTVYYYAAESTSYNQSGTGSLTATIGQATGSVTSAPTNRGVTYNGGNQNLVNAGSGTGTMYYRLGTSGSFSTSIPQASTAGTYTVQYYAAASTNYTQSGTGSVSATIAKASGSVSTAPTNRGVTYNGSNQNLVNAGSGTGTMYYRLGTSGNFTTSIPVASTAGSYTVYYYAAATTNYNQSSTGSVTATIAKANSAVSFSGNGTVQVGATMTKTLTRTAGDGAISYSSSNTGIATVNSSGTVTGVAAGSCTITGTSGASTNYNSASATYTLTVSTPGISATYQNSTYARIYFQNFHASRTVTLNSFGIYIDAGNWRTGTIEIPVNVTLAKYNSSTMNTTAVYQFKFAERCPNPTFDPQGTYGNLYLGGPFGANYIKLYRTASNSYADYYSPWQSDTDGNMVVKKNNSSSWSGYDYQGNSYVLNINLYAYKTNGIVTSVTLMNIEGETYDGEDFYDILTIDHD